MSELFRIEHDSMGAIEVPNKVLWGAQTQRSLLNFAISQDHIPIELIYALAKIKKAAAIVNSHLGNLDNQKRDLIIKAANEIAEGLHDDHFPLKVWQTGSGTQTNMNINEVISNLASNMSGEPMGSHRPVHPNDDVNQSQSTNDTFPAAIHIATVDGITNKLLPEVSQLINAFAKKSSDCRFRLSSYSTHSKKC